MVTLCTSCWDYFLDVLLVKCSVLFEVRTGSVNIIKTSESFKHKTIRNLKFRCLLEATFCYHNVFTFTFLPEGRAGVAWEPSNKMMFFLPPSENRLQRVKIRYHSFLPQYFVIIHKSCHSSVRNKL
jgi:hypothetical protein